jgi:hypothetical protein
VRSALLAATTGALILVASCPAAANGRFPASNQIVFPPISSNLVVVRTTYGILISQNDAKTWNWLCEDTLALPGEHPGISNYEDPELGLTANALIAGLTAPIAGLDVSSDLGCSWSCVGGGLANQQVVDIVVRPNSPHGVLALTATPGSRADAGTSSQVFESKDDGATWAPLGTALDPTDPSLSVTTIDVAPSDSQRIYVSGTRGFGSTRTASLFVSSDDGASWTERPLMQFDPTAPGDEVAIYIGAVDPTDADRVYVRSGGDITSITHPKLTCMADTPSLGPSRLWMSRDAGQTFQLASLPLTCQMLGFALSKDGSKVYAGSYGDGVFVAPSASLTFAKTSSIHAECLATRGQELWACSDEASGFVAGVSTNDGATFTPKLHIDCLDGPIACGASAQGPLACGASANASQCRGAFYDTDLCMLSGVPACNSCGAPDAGNEADAALPPKPKQTPSCGCSMVGGKRAGGFVAACVIAAMALRRRRTR